MILLINLSLMNDPRPLRAASRLYQFVCLTIGMGYKQMVTNGRQLGRSGHVDVGKRRHAPAQRRACRREVNRHRIRHIAAIRLRE